MYLSTQDQALALLRGADPEKGPGSARMPDLTLWGEGRSQEGDPWMRVGIRSLGRSTVLSLCQARAATLG